jgi:hypothetical protein
MASSRSAFSAGSIDEAGSTLSGEAFSEGPWVGLNLGNETLSRGLDGVGAGLVTRWSTLEVITASSSLKSSRSADLLRINQ